MSPQSSKSTVGWILFAIAIIGIPFTILFFYVAGQTSGIEFSPDDFSRRSFSYNQTPYFNWVIHKKVYKDVTTPLEEHLVLDGFIPTVINTTKSWHLIDDSGSYDRYVSDQCDARFLTSYLDLADEEGDDYWTVWNTDYPKTAKVFWPFVAEIARDKMYLKVPDVMQFAMEIKSDNVGQFTKQLNELLGDIYLELGELDFELGDLERAKVRLEKSVKFQPTEKAKQLLDSVSKTHLATQLKKDDE